LSGRESTVVLSGKLKKKKMKNGRNMKREKIEDSRKCKMEDKMRRNLCPCPSVFKHNDSKKYDRIETHEQFDVSLFSAVD
jgi:hypothetical protein